MTEKESKLLQDFEEKVLQLTSMYNLLEENYKKLEKTNSELKNQIFELQKENKSIKKDYQNATMAIALSGSHEDSSMTKNKINRLIKEIDQCIAMLSK